MHHKKTFFSFLIVPVAFWLSIILIFLSILFSTNRLAVINPENFLNWDAMHYHAIASSGYSPVNTAFFPLFPLVWFLSGLSSVGISVLNLIVFILSFTWLSRLMNWSKFQQLILLSIPSAIFFVLPYSESLFFLCGVIILAGIRKQNLLLLAIGLFLSSISRPAVYFFIPGLVLIFLWLTQERKMKWILVSLIALIAGLFLTLFIQSRFTGNFFGFFAAQSNWGNHLQLPQLPLKSWGGDNMSRYDASALAVGLVCGAILIWYIFNRKNWFDKLRLQGEFVFSLAYIFSIVLMVVFMRGGVLFSLNRFVYATPFFLIAFTGILSGLRFSWKYVSVLLLVYILFSFLFASYNHIHNLLCYVLSGLFFLLPMFIKHPHKLVSFFAMWFFFIGNLIIMYHLLLRFLNNFWVA